MASKVSKRLVIDADVARACGGKTAKHPVSKGCRDFLLAVLEVCHRLVMTPEIRNEWKRHASSFSRGWQVSMWARKKVVRPAGVPGLRLRERIGALQIDAGCQQAMLKDAHLLEAALGADLIVVSKDNEVRTLFGKAVKNIAEIGPIVWVNPVEETNARKWLEDGAEARPELILGKLRE